MKLLQKIERKQEEKQKCLAVLLDPDKVEMKGIMNQVETYVSAGVDLFLVGGSLISGNNFYILVEALRRQKDIPVVIFPGSNLHIHSEADGILLLSLISGRNPELLIGQHVIAAPILKNSGLEILPTGYMLIESGKPTTVSYISNTQPIPADKEDIAVCTAMAGEMLGLRLLYLDGGSGAINPVPPKMISAVRRNTRLPVIVGGGITSGTKAEQAWLAGADYVVIGNGLEKEPELLDQIIKVRNRINQPSGALA
ncbi:MAG TPA: geranylgeranylglyceryl/heptaprenylglyceryl phosphate synthase [Catalimonadaceae bacterium]|nr:geranylgeranylglyceryl/heptaprenylglyceryl phosphate synthase [Catalimonadaceae bacterium]HPI11779.1 geranylgeranylglyceryl/heptaprenylglyceryl phosphate synthase [Catalimonadaceae bacterium]